MTPGVPNHEVRPHSAIDLITSFYMPDGRSLVLPTAEEVLKNRPQDPLRAQTALQKIRDSYDQQVADGTTLLDPQGVQSLRTNPAVAPAVFIQAWDNKDHYWMPTPSTEGGPQGTRDWSKKRADNLYDVIKADLTGEDTPFMAEALRRHPEKTTKSALRDSLSSLHAAVTRATANNPGLAPAALREAAFVQALASLTTLAKHGVVNHEAPIPRISPDEVVAGPDDDQVKPEYVTVEELLTPGQGQPTRHHTSALGKLAGRISEGWNTLGAVTASKIYGSQVMIAKNSFEHKHGKRLNATMAISAGALVLKAVAAARGIEIDLPDVNLPDLNPFNDDNHVEKKPAHPPESAPEQLPADRPPMSNDTAAEKLATKNAGVPTPAEANAGKAPMQIMPEYKTADDSMWRSAQEQFEADFVSAGGDKDSLTQHDLDVAASRITDAWATQNHLSDPDIYSAGQDYRMEDFYTASKRAAYDQMILGLLDSPSDKKTN